jgi:hypothetical protein
MKKILLLFAAVGIVSLSGCEGPQGPPGTNIEAPIFELLNVNFTYSDQFGYNIYRTFSTFGIAPFDSDNVLIYRLSGTIDPQTPIWQLIPRTLFLPEGELDYDFDFSREDFTIYAGGTYDLATTPSFLNGQTFRIVIIPGYFSSRRMDSVDLSDYNAVIEAYGIDDSHIVQL